MNKRERQEILGQWGVREPNSREAAQSEEIATEVSESPLSGRRLPVRPRLFRLEADSYIASLGGPLPYMVRLREIDRLTAEAERALEQRWRELAGACAEDPAGFSRSWLRIAQRWSFVEVNDLIERHNRWYPVEARLPFDPSKRDYVLVGGRHYSRRPLDPGWVLERFPPVLSEAETLSLSV
jgi:hypothetical protein